MTRRCSIELALVAVLLSTAAGCQKDRTEIVIGMATDLTAPHPLSSVTMQIQGLLNDYPVGSAQPKVFSVSGQRGLPYELPATFAVYSATGSSDRFRAVLTATDDMDATLIVRSAVMSLVPEKTLFVRLGLVAACEGTAGQCGPGQTCIEGRCQSEDVDSAQLPAYVTGLEGRVECTSATNFIDTSTRQPLTISGTSCGVGSCLEGICLSPSRSDGGAGAGGATGSGSAGAGGAAGGSGTAGAGGAVGTSGSGGASGGTGAVGGRAGATGGSGTAGDGGEAGTGGSGAGGAVLAADQSVLERNKHPSRDGVFLEPTLTQGAAATMAPDTGFAAAFSGNVYGSPLYLPNGPTGVGLFFVATTGNNVFALNETTGATVWQHNIGSSPTATGAGCGNISPLGIISTPVIDATTTPPTIYVAGAIGTTSIMNHQIHALSVVDGTEVTGWPVNVMPVSSGNVVFNTVYQNQRAALSLVNGTLYVPYGGHIGECAGFHGWVIGIDTRDPATMGTWASSGEGEGIWASGGMASDGNGVLALTGNSTAGVTVHADSEEAVRITGMGTLSDSFYPAAWHTMDAANSDLGGSSPVYVELPGATPSKLVVAVAKDGHLYLLDAGNLGGLGGQAVDYMVANGAGSVHHPRRCLPDRPGPVRHLRGEQRGYLSSRGIGHGGHVGAHRARIAAAAEHGLVCTGRQCIVGTDLDDHRRNP